MLVDSHAHLDQEDFDGDREQVLRRAGQAGVAAMINAGVAPGSWRRAQELFAAREDIFAAVGVHPHQAKDFREEHLAELTTLWTTQRKVLALGECGLDYFRDYSPRQQQRRAFAAQLGLALKLEAPVIIHSRAAAEETQRLLEEAAAAAGKPIRGVVHSFDYDAEQAARFLELGLSLGFTGAVTYRKSEGLRAAARQCPPERLLLETDCPYLAPCPHRGKRNEPAFLAHTADFLAHLRGELPEQLARQTSRNAIVLFRMPLQVPR